MKKEMEPKDVETQQIFEETLKHLKGSLFKLLECDAPTPALEVYTDFIGKLDSARGIHKMLAEIDENEINSDKGFEQLMNVLKKRSESRGLN